MKNKSFSKHKNKNVSVEEYPLKPQCWWVLRSFFHWKNHRITHFCKVSVEFQKMFFMKNRKKSTIFILICWERCFIFSLEKGGKWDSNFCWFVFLFPNIYFEKTKLIPQHFYEIPQSICYFWMIHSATFVCVIYDNMSDFICRVLNFSLFQIIIFFQK